MPDSSSPPSAPELREAALTYIARYASTEASVRRVLMRRVEKWRSQQPETAAEIIPEIRSRVEEVIKALVKAGLVDDLAFAVARGNSLRREGRSGRAARMKLLTKGVSAALIGEALPDDPEAELAAAVMTARRRRLGAFGQPETGEPRDLSRDLAKLLRAGFSLSVAQRALAMDPEDADTLIREARR